jgi:hypothetical protein
MSPTITQRSALNDTQPRAEWLVGVGFRCWIAGYETGDISCWEHVWSEYAAAVGAAKAKPLVTELACWVREVRAASSRPITVYPGGCIRFCNDECTAISMIAACQHACPAARACAFALLGNDHVDVALNAATDFAEALRNCGELLGDPTISSIAAAIRCSVIKPQRSY